MIKINRLLLPTIPALLFLLTACSPHPGSGHWHTTAEDNPGFMTDFIRIEVNYEGRADIFGQGGDTPESNEAIRRCFWQGQDPHTILMTCVQASNTDIEQSFQFRVSPDKDSAEMLLDNHLIGRFSREERPEIEHSYKEILQPQ